MQERGKKSERLDIGKQIVIFIGPEGSGKTTIAEKFAKESDKPYITTGGIFRDLRDNDKGPLGEACRQMFANNAYMDSQTLLNCLAARMAKPDTTNGVVMDGALRTTDETRNFQKMLGGVGRNLPITIVYLDIPAWSSFERLTTGPNARKRIDGKGGGDTQEGVSKRLSNFYFGLRERLDIIGNQMNWSLVRIDATKTPDEVYSEVEDYFRFK